MLTIVRVYRPEETSIDEAARNAIKESKILEMPITMRFGDSEVQVSPSDTIVDVIDKYIMKHLGENLWTKLKNTVFLRK